MSEDKPKPDFFVRDVIGQYAGVKPEMIEGVSFTGFAGNERRVVATVVIESAQQNAQ